MAKTCTKCGDTKPLGEYHKNRHHKDGHDYYCKQCKHEVHQANREKISERKRAHYAANKEKISERKRAHYAANGEGARERQRTYHHKNRDFLIRNKSQQQKEMNGLTRLTATRKSQRWEQWEDDFIANHPEMTEYQLATHIGRTYAGTRNRKARLRKKGLLA